MTTLADIALTCAKQLGRASADGTTIVDLETEIKDEIANTVRMYNRRPWHLTETRLVSFTTVANQIWYTDVVTTNAVGAQTTAETAASDEISEVSEAVILLDALSTDSRQVSDILSIDYMRENESSLTDGLRRISYEYFERLNEGSNIGGVPTAYTVYAEQIGIYPTPTKAFEITMSCKLKPLVPTQDTDISVWFVEAPELIEATTCARVALKYLRSPEQAQLFQPVINACERDLHGEFVRKGRTGKLTAHD